MFTVVYSFEVKSTQCDVFEESWSQLTKLIYQYEGSLGSRLHKVAVQSKEDFVDYIAYAQWPSRQLWENSGGKLPREAEAIRNTMKNACNNISALYELNVVDDLLASATKK